MRLAHANDFIQIKHWILFDENHLTNINDIDQKTYNYPKSHVLNNYVYSRNSQTRVVLLVHVL